MASNQDKLRNQLTKREQGTAPAKTGGYSSVEWMLEKYRNEITQALPAHLVGEQFMRLILQEFRLNPQLIQCSPASILGAVMTCARLGLEPGSLGMIYLIPFKRSVKEGGDWSKILEAQVQVGYRGYVQLAYRSEKVASITPYTINENDLFEWHGGHDNMMRHEITDWQNRGKVLGYYLVIKMKDGATAVSRPWSAAEVETHRKKFAQTSGAAMTPAWKNSYDTMAFKTVFKDMVRWFPISTEMVSLAKVDENTVRSVGGESDLGELLATVDYSEGEVVVEGEVTAEDGSTVNPATGEVVSEAPAGPKWEGGEAEPNVYDEAEREYEEKHGASGELNLQ
jgi:recombination protein RecT